MASGSLSKVNRGICSTFYDILFRDNLILLTSSLYFFSGATMYDYVVTADDVGTLLAVDCTPMDDNGRQVII